MDKKNILFFEDELTKLGDFTKLEERIMAAYGISEFGDLGKVQGRALADYKNSQIDAYFSIANVSSTGRTSQVAIKERSHGNLPFGMPYRGSGKNTLLLQYLQQEIWPKPADHPSRKREPKGPRGKWGKVK